MVEKAISTTYPLLEWWFYPALVLKNATLKPTPQKAIINEDVFIKATDLTHYRIFFILCLAEVRKAD